MNSKVDMAAESVPEQRWQAIVSRRPAGAGSFVYAVTTTGVYCRPGCGSRRPRRENVVCFDTPSDAERAGFRPCLRCQSSDMDEARNAAIVREARHLIESSVDEPSLQTLADRSGLSRFHFLRLFRKSLGVTPKQYALRQRLEKLRNNLGNGEDTLSAIHQAGFNAPSRAYATAGRGLGMPPAAFRAGGRGVQIRYVVVETCLDWMLVAATARGLCLVAFAGSSEAATDALKKRFPAAELLPADRRLKRQVHELQALLDQPDAIVDLPLDQAGTAFQQRVWRALRQIPFGQTISYSELAKRIGHPKAVRAVARACALNDLALIVPCHRVVGADQRMHGYRWGIARKQSLLDRERDAVQAETKR